MNGGGMGGGMGPMGGGMGPMSGGMGPMGGGMGAMADGYGAAQAGAGYGAAQAGGGYGAAQAGGGYGLAMQLVGMFQGSPDPYSAAAAFVANLGMQQGNAQGFGAQKRPRAGAPVAGDRGNWVCPSCANINFGFRDECNKCKTPKPTDDGQVQ